MIVICLQRAVCDGDRSYIPDFLQAEPRRRILLSTTSSPSPGCAALHAAGKDTGEPASRHAPVTLDGLPRRHAGETPRRVVMKCPPSKICAPRPAPLSLPAQMSDRGQAAAAPRPIRPTSPGLQAALLHSFLRKQLYCCSRPQTCEPQVPRRPGRDPDRSPSCCLAAAHALLRQGWGWQGSSGSLTSAPRPTIPIDPTHGAQGQVTTPSSPPTAGPRPRYAGSGTPELG
jgi:hypothetical protein